jgi:HD-GYP domain-containing protein (c-di-GMP phosphodiesterase class II)
VLRELDDVAVEAGILTRNGEARSLQAGERAADKPDVHLIRARRLGETLGLAAVAAAGPAVVLFAVGHQMVMVNMLAHCIVVGTAGAAMFAASIAMTVVGARRRDGRAVTVGAAFSTMSAMLFVHALASPGVLVGPNGLVQLAGAGNLPAGVVILSLSSLPALRRPESVRPLVALQALAFGGVVAIGTVGLLRPGTFPVMPGPGGTPAHIVLAAGLVLVGAAAHRAARTYLLTRRLADLSVVVGFAWMACALVGLLEYDTMQAGFWVAHVFEVSGVFLLGVPAALDLHRGAQSYPLVGDLSAIDLVRREEAFLGARVRALMVRLAEKDGYTEAHTRGVALLAVQVGERVGLAPSQLRSLALGGLLHDIGKLSVPDEILQKPGALDDEEFREIRKHPASGEELLHELGGFGPEIHRLVLDHHERLDGAGYPRGLDESQLDLATRILTVCDVYDALISKRVYRDAWSPERALALLHSEIGTAFDGRCVEALESLVVERRPAATPCTRLVPLAAA